VGLSRTLVELAILGTAGIGECDAESESEPALSPRAGEGRCHACRSDHSGLASKPLSKAASLNF